MRPEEINYSSQARHFFDTSNGEIIAGKRALRAYLAAGSSEEEIVDLGAVLRRPSEEIAGISFEPIDTSEWEPARFAAYGRWINKIVAPPIDEGEKRLNQDVLTTAHRLGIGPGRRAIRKVFGTYGNLYKEIKAPDTHIIGNFKEWSVDDYVDYIRRVGGDRRPNAGEFDRRAKKDPTKPKADYMRATFRDIGGFNKLLELAGYPVIDLWDKDDYVSWGVKFMEANEGLVPTSRMTDFLSTKRLGPSGASIRNKFDKMGSYQREVIQAFEESVRKKDEEQAAMIVRIRADLLSGAIPSELFAAGQDLAANDQLEIGKRDTTAYAKYKVLESVAPNIAVESRVALSLGVDQDRSFVGAVRKRNPHITAGDIEHAALVLGLFDYVWPLNDHLGTLKIGAEYVDYYKAREKVTNMKSRHLLAAA